MTKIQQSIYDILSHTSDHLTAEQVLGLTKRTHPTVSLSTVYRNLNHFAETGKIRRIQRAVGADYYERNLAPHDHAYCVCCGRISDFTLPDLKAYLTKNFDYPILSFELLVNYLCPECAAKTPEINPPGKEKCHVGRQEETHE